ncbi:MAG: acyl-CoA dehydrogenase, partial [Terriglobales bacterium]
EPLEGPLAAERTMIMNAKKAGLMVSGVATQKYMMALQDQQEVMGAMADMITEVYAMESAVLRAHKLIVKNGEASSENAVNMTRVYLATSIDKVESAAKKVLAACAEGDMLRTQMTILRRLFKNEPIDSITLRQKIATKVIEAGKYVM